jgi:hypothetical protein
MRDDEPEPIDATALGAVRGGSGQMSVETYPRVVDGGEAAAGSSLSSRRGIAILSLLCLVQFMDVLDASILNIALPSIKRDLGFTQQSLQWVINGYILTYGGLLLLGGRAADLLGRRRMLITGLFVFAGASLAGGLAQSESLLVAARFVQGAGAAMLSPAALSSLTTIFRTDSDRHKALGAWGGFGARGRRRGALRWTADGRSWLALGAVRERSVERGCARGGPAPAGGW